MVYLIHKVDVWLVLSLASTINPWSFLAGSNVASSPVSFVLAPWKLSFRVTFPICLVSHQQRCWLSCAVRAGSQCQHCLQPQLPWQCTRLCGPGCFLEEVGLWPSGPQRRESRHLSFRKCWG